MTPARQHLPGSTYLISRRTSERRFFLRPDSLITRLIMYILAVAAGLFGVKISAVVVLSNHLHLLVTDPEGRISDFCQYVFSLMARATNCFRGRWESLWAPGNTSIVRLETEADVVSKWVYLLANPCEAGLVQSLELWPGFRTLPTEIEVERVVKRPPIFFRKNGAMPKKAVLRLVKPEMLSGTNTAELSATLCDKLEIEEAKSRTRIRKSGRRFMGVKRVLRVNPNHSPNTIAPRRRLNPHIACRDADTRVAAIGRLRRFRRQYRRALEAFVKGEKDVIFPAGTVMMRRRYGVNCEDWVPPRELR